MNAQDDNTAPSRTGMRRIIPRFEFRRLRAMARVRIAVGTVLVGLGVITLVGGSFTPKAVVWAAFFLVLAALQFSVGYWYLAIVRSAAPRTLGWFARTGLAVLDELAGSCWHRSFRPSAGVPVADLPRSSRRRQDPRE